MAPTVDIKSVLTVEMVPVSSLKPARYNPRRIKAAALKGLSREVKEFGLVENLVANRRSDGSLVLVGSHQRLKVAKDLGMKAVPVHVVRLDPKREKALNLALNNPNLQGEWDIALLAPLLNVLQHEDGMGEVAGFSDKEIAAVLRLAHDDATARMEGKVPALPRRAESKPGQVFDLGPHRLMCGDATSKKDVKVLLSGMGPIDCVLTDPPYGAALGTNWNLGRTNFKPRAGDSPHAGKRYDPTMGDDRPFDPTPLFDLYQPAREMFLFGADYYHQRLPDRGSWMVWDKRNESLDDAVGSHFELIWSRRRHKRSILRHLWCGWNSAGREANNRVHANQKPVALMVDILTRYTKRGQVVADPYAGSGTVLIACEQLGRRCLSMELDPRYCDVIRERWKQHRKAA